MYRVRIFNHDLPLWRFCSYLIIGAVLGNGALALAQVVSQGPGQGPAPNQVAPWLVTNNYITAETTFSAVSSCAAPSDTAITFGAGCITIPMSGRSTAGVMVRIGTLVGTGIAEASYDGGQVFDAIFAVFNGAQSTGFVFTNPNPAVGINFLFSQNTTHLRFRLSAYTSGSAVVDGTATNVMSALGIGVLSSGYLGVASAPPFWAEYGGMRTVTTTVPTAAVQGIVVGAIGDAYGVPFVQNADHPNRFHCAMTSTAVASTLITGCIGAGGTTAASPGAGLSRYITDIDYNSSIISTTANFMTLQYGTGTNCGTGTVVIWRSGNSAAFLPVIKPLTRAIKVGAATDLCFLHPGAGTRLINVTGFIAPG
jgi:hypothetical protein